MTVAQLVEHRLVVPMVAGSSPVGHPIFPFHHSLCHTGLMLPGYNHNIEYRDRTFHVQTEDSGIDNPHIITHLFEGGNILETRKCDYANILDSEQRDKVLMSLMLNQHQALIRDLEGGQLDSILESPAQKAPSPEAPAKAPPEASVEEPEPAPPASDEAKEPEPPDAAEQAPQETQSELPAWLAELAPGRIISRKVQAPVACTRNEEELARLAQSTIDKIVDAGSGMPMPSSTTPQDTLDDALSVILAAADKEVH